MESLNTLKAQLSAVIQKIISLADKMANTTNPEIKSALVAEYDTENKKKADLEAKIRKQKSLSMGM